VTKAFVAIGAILLAASMAGRARAGDTGKAALNFKIFCAGCHGFSGHGDGPNAGTLPNKPQDFADCGQMAKKPDAILLKAIKGGGASVGLPSTMPAWATGLSDKQIEGLVAYIRGFCPKK